MYSRIRFRVSIPWKGRSLAFTNICPVHLSQGRHIKAMASTAAIISNIKPFYVNRVTIRKYQTCRLPHKRSAISVQSWHTIRAITQNNKPTVSLCNKYSTHFSPKEEETTSHEVGRIVSGPGGQKREPTTKELVELLKVSGMKDTIEYNSVPFIYRKPLPPFCTPPIFADTFDSPMLGSCAL